MKPLVNWLRKMASPKGRLGRKGFFLVFLCALVSIEVFAFLTFQLWLLYGHLPFVGNIKYELKICEFFGWFCIISGMIPLAVLFIGFCLIDSFIIGYRIGFELFFIETVVVAMFYVLYIIQCIRRCHDMGRSWWFCLIPLYNPFMLLLGKSADQGLK